jgi:hypothetical protein
MPSYQSSAWTWISVILITALAALEIMLAAVI